jgi:hypothetical protein
LGVPLGQKNRQASELARITPAKLGVSSEDFWPPNPGLVRELFLDRGDPPCGVEAKR